MMGPWTFNLYESVLAATPAVLVLRIFDFLYPPTQDLGAPTADSFAAQFVPRPLREDAASIVPDVNDFLVPFWLPLSMTLLALIVVRAVIVKPDRTAENSMRVRDAFLYMDGAYGLLPQTLFNLSLAAVIIFGNRGIQSLPVVLGALAGVIYFLGYELWRIYEAVPRFLFAVAGYPECRVPWRGLRFRLTETEKRWARYSTRIVLGGWIVALSLVVLHSLAWLIATALAFVRSLV